MTDLFSRTTEDRQELESQTDKLDKLDKLDRLGLLNLSPHLRGSWIYGVAFYPTTCLSDQSIVT